MTAAERLEALVGPNHAGASLDAVPREQAAELAARPTASSEQEWLTLEQAGRRLGCSPDAVRMRVKRGRLRTRRPGRRVYVSAVSVSDLGGQE